MPQRDEPTDVQQTQHQRAYRTRPLREDQDPTLVVPIGQHPTPHRQEQRRAELQGHDDAHRQRVAVRERQYQPVLGDALHPRADQRNDLSGSPKAVVAVVERGKHAGIGVSGHPTILPLE